MKYGYYLLALSLPFSIKTSIGSSGIDLLFPSEALIALLAIGLGFKWMLNGFGHGQFMRHPVSILILAYLLLSGLSVCFSTMPLVSAKAFIVRLSYVIVFYFGAFTIFEKDKNSGIQLFLIYGFSLFFITLYCLNIQSQFNWDKQTAGYSVNPFYSDHTIYSACVAFILPSYLMLFSQSTINKLSLGYRILGWFFIVLFLLGIYFTFCRAAWISLFIGTVFWLTIRLKFSPRLYLTLITLGVLLIVLNMDALIFAFKDNKNVSTAPNTTAIEQTQSITNVSTDVSNAERLNRWSCAWRMFLDKKLTGFGPGTFQFQYLSYQLPDEITYISVFNPYNIELGRGGSTHNEYLLLLSECGLFAFASFILLILTIIQQSLRAIYLSAQNHSKYALISLLIGLVTYLTHGFFNNFLDTDKAAFLFWVSIALVMSQILKQKRPST